MFKEKVSKSSRRYSSIAQLAERMTVNHDVAGSSPAGGAIKGDYFFVSHLFCFEKLGSNSKRCKCTSDAITPFFVTKIHIKMID